MVSDPPEVCTLPSRCFGYGLDIPHTSAGVPDGRVAGWRGAWSCCCKGIPQNVPEGLFLFGKILLLSPAAAPSIQGRACLLAQPTSPARLGTVQVRAPHGPTLNSPQPAPMDSLGFPLCPYSSPCDFKQPGLCRCCSSLVWQERELSAGLSPRSPVADPSGSGLVLQSPWSLRWSQGPVCPEAIPLPSVFSVSSILFGLLSS